MKEVFEHWDEKYSDFVYKVGLYRYYRLRALYLRIVPEARTRWVVRNCYTG